MGGLPAPSAPLGRCIALPKPSNSRPMHLSCPQLTPYDHLSRPGTAAQGGPEAVVAAGEGGSAPDGEGGVRTVRPEAAEAARAAPRARFRSRADCARPITPSYRYVNSRGVPRACCVPGTVPSGPGPVGRWSRDMLRPADLLGRPAALHLSLLYGPDVILTFFNRFTQRTHSGGPAVRSEGMG